jgi:hypothetical protein
MANQTPIKRAVIGTLIAVALISITVSGCQAHSWAPGAGKSSAEFTRDNARCQYVARHGGTDMFAFGNANYVAGAMIGHAIGNAIRAQNDYNDCMEMTGWEVADPK